MKTIYKIKHIKKMQHVLHNIRNPPNDYYNDILIKVSYLYI